MSALGDLLELLHGAGSRWTTAAVTIRIWRRRDLDELARRRWERGLRGGATTDAAAAPEATGEHVETIRLWIAKPDRSRQEWDGAVSITNGATWTTYHPLHGYLTNAGDTAEGYGDPLDTFGHLLDPARLLPALDFDRRVEREETLVVTARPRPSGHRVAVYGVGNGADEHELVVDLRLGVLLRAESRLRGEPFLVWELVEPSFDVDLPDELFTLTPPPGEEAVTPGELHAHGISPEEAAARASFAVFVVGELPEGPWRLTASHSRPRGAFPEAVSLLYHRSDGRGQILVTQFPAASGHQHWDSGAARAEVERDGTRVVLTSEDLPEDELHSLAAALVPT